MRKAALIAGNMAVTVRAFDWSATPLGPIERWPASLTTVVDLMLKSPQPTTLAVGSDRIFLYNDEAAQLYGSRHPEVFGKPLRQAFEHEFDQVAAFYDRVFAGESVHVPAQALDPGKTGTPEVFDAYLTPVHAADARVIAAFVTVTSTSARLRAETALRDSEQRFRAFVTATSDVVYRMSPDWSEMRQLDGRGFLSDTAEPTGSWMDGYIPSDDQPAVREAIEQAILTGMPFELEHKVIRADGTAGWTASRAVPIRGADGQINEWLGAAADVTARKQTQKALRESEEEYRTLFESIDQGFCTIEMRFDEQGRADDYVFLRTNRAFLAQAGFGDENIVGKNMRTFAPDHEQFWFDTYARVARTGRPERFEHEASALGLWYNVYAFRPKEGTRDQVAVLFEDITARKRIEAELRESEERQAFLLKLSDTLRPLADAVDVMKAASEALGRHLNVGRCAYCEVDEAGDYFTVERDWTDGVMPSFVGRHFFGFGDQFLEDYRAGKSVVIDDALADARAVGGEAAFEAAGGVRAAIGIPLIKGGRFAAGFFVQQREPRHWTAQDKTLTREVAERTWAALERARAEAALRESEQRLTLAVAASKLGVWEWDLVSDRAVGNTFFYEHFDLDPATEVVGVDVIAKLHPNDIPVMLAIHAVAMDPASDGHYTAEYRVLREGAGPRWLSSYGQVDFSGEGGERRPERSHGTTLDITEQKLAEAALRESEARLSAAFESVPAGIAVIDTAGRTVIANSLYRGFLPKGLIPSRDPERAWHWRRWDEQGRAIDPQNAPSARALRGESVVPGQEMLHTDDAGREIWTQIAAVPVRDAGGRITGIATVISDIDAKKRAETALRESEQALAADLAGASLLRDLSERLGTEEDLATIHEEILAAAIAITRSDGGTIQVYEPETRSLILLVTRGFDRRMTDHFHRVDADSETACGGALREGRRTLIDFDMDETNEEFRMHVAAGYRSAQATPLLARAGAPLGMLNTHWHASEHRPSERELRFLDLLARQAADLIERAQAQRRLRESEERLRQFGEASQDVLWIRDAETLQWRYLTPAFETIYGLSRAEALSGDNYRSWLDLILPEDRAHASVMIARAGSGEQVTFEYRVRRPRDGAIRWLRNTDFPIFNDAGQVELIGGIGHDATELREIEQRLRALVEGMPQLVWRAVDGGEWTWASPQWTEFTGQSEPESEGWGWIEALHPDDRVLAREAWSHAVEHGRLEVEYRLRRQQDGLYRWFQTRAVPVRDKAGIIIEWLGTSTDVHDIRELRERQQVLVAELQHRTRNLLGLVHSMADKTARASVDLADFRGRFRDRLEALSRTQGLLSKLNDLDRVTFDDLIGTELAAMDGGADRVTLNGPRGVRLRSSTVQTLAMALHELATNAIKYGALGQASGRLAIAWAFEVSGAGNRPWLHIDWREIGVTMPSPGSAPNGTGQGRELIEKALPYQLGAKTTYIFGLDGVHCTISIPVSRSDGEAHQNG